MSERQQELTEEEVAAIVAERKAKAEAEEAAAEEAQFAARKRFGVSILLALIATYHLTIGHADGTREVLWVCALLLAGGLASVDQIQTMLGRK